MGSESSLFILVLIFAHSANSNPVTTLAPVPPIAAVNDHAASNVDTPLDSAGSRINCNHDAECINSVLGSESVCLGTTCHCKPNAVQSPTSYKCLIKRDTLGSGCEEPQQCSDLGDASCRNGICSCNDKAEVVNNLCWKKITLGNSCDHDEQCVDHENSRCTDKRCVCRNEFVSHPDNTKCLRVAHQTGDKCAEPVQCSAELGDGVTCQKGECKCLEGYHDKNKACVKTLLLGDQCKNVDGAECFLANSFGVTRVECVDTCQCLSSFVASDDKKHCLVPGEKDPGTGGARTIYPFVASMITVMAAILLVS